MSELAEAQIRADREAAVRAAWSSGKLRYKLDSNQRRVYDAIEAVSGGSFFFNKPRRIGGSYLLVVRAVEQCLRKQNAQIRYAAPTAKALRKIVQPNLRKVLADCPPSLRPKWSTLEQEYRFPNGSTLALSGCDAQRYEDLRGTEADEIYMDEVGFIDDLDYILNDILLPQTQDTKGRVILISTPARSPSHPSVKVANKHIATGRYFTCTVWDNPRHTRDQQERYFRTLAGDLPLEKFYQTSMFRREYMAEFVIDEERAVIPEWTKQRQFDCVFEPSLPEAFDAYAGIDLGWRDGSAYVLGYWDFPGARLVVTDELLAFKQPLDQFQANCEAIEANRIPRHKHITRVSDSDPQALVIAEMNRRRWSVRAAVKRDKELSVNLLRELVRDGKLILHPRCQKLNAQLLGTTWNAQRTSFERNADGHGDLLDALLYLTRSVIRNKDPLRDRQPMTNYEVFSAYGVAEKGGSKLEQALLDSASRFNN